MQRKFRINNQKQSEDFLGAKEASLFPNADGVFEEKLKEDFSLKNIEKPLHFR